MESRGSDLGEMTEDKYCPEEEEEEDDDDDHDVRRMTEVKLHYQKGQGRDVDGGWART